MHWIAPAEKDNDFSALEKLLWDAADQFRANSGLKAQTRVTEGFNENDVKPPRRFVFGSPGKLRDVSGCAGRASFIETEVYQQDAHGGAGGNPGYAAAARPDIFFASSVYL
jgi:hypothetical protein